MKAALREIERIVSRLAGKPVFYNGYDTHSITCVLCEGQGSVLVRDPIVVEDKIVRVAALVFDDDGSINLEQSGIFLEEEGYSDLTDFVEPEEES